MSQTQQVQGVATTIATYDGITNVLYHGTAVVAFNSDKVVLNSGGWRTVTTKLRMNQASNQFGLGYSVFQKDFAWYVAIPGKSDSDIMWTELEFQDGMEIPR